MTHLILTAALVLGADAQGPDTQSKPPVPRRGVVELERSVNAAIRYARAPKADLEAAARKLIALHWELERAERARREDRARLLSMVRSRLVRVGDRLAHRVKIARRKRPRGILIRSDAEATPANSPGLRTESRGGGARGGAAGEEDHGAELVELIQQVIFPEMWDVNGGNSSIYYFRARHALVVRAPSEVHGHVGGLLRQFRR